MKIAIYGYGNLGKGVEIATKYNSDVELIGVFTRRNPHDVKTLLGTKVYSADDILSFKDQIDVLIICGGSATDLPTLTPTLAKNFNVVDSFDTHAKIPSHYENVDKESTNNGRIALISSGWDPGMFSIQRLYAGAILPNGKDYTFWGRGVSQGHSDAIRRIPGVIDAKQYTVPIEDALKAVRSGDEPTLTTRQKHLRECYVVVEDGADKEEIERQIKQMPNYFADYDTTVNFISLEELKRNHSGIPHGGVVIRTGKTGQKEENTHVIEYKLKLDSNPEFTASVLVACARAIYKMYNRGERGCKTIFDIAPSDLTSMSPSEIRKTLL
ncbi:MAG: diaminopimelate dehydrogenase [Clostridia bacterium]|nr:diaminopimelate dehydrogenase [Clostridia bacterium]